MFEELTEMHEDRFPGIGDEVKECVASAIHRYIEDWGVGDEKDRLLYEILNKITQSVWNP